MNICFRWEKDSNLDLIGGSVLPHSDFSIFYILHLYSDISEQKIYDINLKNVHLNKIITNILVYMIYKWRRNIIPFYLTPSLFFKVTYSMEEIDSSIWFYSYHC